MSVRSVKHRGVVWVSFNPGYYECNGARVYKNIRGTWNFCALVGHRGKDGICNSIGHATMKEAMDMVDISKTLEFQQQQERIQRKY